MSKRAEPSDFLLESLKQEDKILAYTKTLFDRWAAITSTRTNKKVIRSNMFNTFAKPLLVERFPEKDEKFLKRILKEVWISKEKEGLIRRIEGKKGSFEFV